jgi:large conductance mechanosensitive channel
MLKEFRAFILRGNVVDLAVGIVIGAAFTAVVATFTSEMLTPLIALLGGGGDFAKLDFAIGDSDFNYGMVLNAIVAFLLTAAVVFFFVVKPLNRLMERYKTEPEVEAPTKSCSQCLSNIPAAARRCAFCTSEQ